MRYSLPIIIACFASTLNAADFYTKAGISYVNPSTDGTIEKSLQTSTSLDSNYAPNVEIGYLFKLAESYRFSLGLAFSQLETDASLNSSLTTVEAIDLNSLLDTTFVAGSISAKEEYDIKNVTFILGYEWDVSERVYFNLSAGIGISKITQTLKIINDGESLSSDDDDQVLTIPLGAGVGYSLTEQLSLEANARYYFSGDTDFDHEVLSVKGGDADSIALGLSLRYLF